MSEPTSPLAPTPLPSTPALPQTIRYHYLKSPHFHTIRCDGAMGGITPRAGIHLALYAERPAIPKEQEFHVEPSGRVEREIEASRIGREGIVRELQIDTVMDYETALSLYALLGGQLKTLSAILGKPAPLDLLSTP